MNLLSQHIEYLLLERDCVILPGVGAFIATYRPARIEDGGLRILPPSRSISFNSEVKVDDGLLCHSFGRQLQIPFAEARQIVVKMVSELETALDNSGEVQMGTVGTLRRGPEGNISFVPYVSESEGLRLEGAGEVAIADPVQEEPVAAPLESEAKVKESSVRKRESSRYYHIRIPKRPFKVAVSLVLAIGVTLGVALNMRHGSEARQSGASMASVVPLETIVNAVAGEMVERESSDLLDSEDETVGSMTVEESSPVEKRYHLIVATFPGEKGARKYISARGEEGADLSVCPGKSGICRVSVASSDDRSELQRMMGESSFRDRYPESWIWESR